MSSEGTSPRGDRKHSSKRKSGSGGGTVAGKTTTHHHRKKAHSKEKDRESLPKGERSAVVPPSSPSASSLSSSGHHHHRGGRRRTHRSHAAASTSSETEPLDAELPYWGKLVSFCSEAHPDVELSLPKELLGRGPQCHPASRYTDTTISTVHCQISYEQKRTKHGHHKYCVYLEDTSSNGTYVNGSLVGKGKVIRLRTSDEITFVVPNIYDEDYSPTESIAYTYLDFFEQWRGAAPSVPSSPAAASSSSSPAPVLVLPALPKKQKEKGKEDGEHEDSEQQDFLSSYRVSPRQPQRHQPEEQKQRAGFDPAKVGGVSLLAPSSPSPSVARRKEGQSAEAPSPASARTTSPATPQAKESGGASGQAEKTQPFDHLLTAEQFMRELQVNCEADLLAALNERLRTCEESWLISFLDITGMDLLLDVLSHSDRKSKRTPSDEQIEWECIRCVETVLNTELGFELIFEVPQLLEDLALFLDSSNVQVRAKIPQIFAAICLYSPEAHELILRSMTFFKEAKKEKARFERLVRSLTDPGNSVQYKVHCMCLINHMIDGVTEVEHRVELREEFVRLGLLDLMRPLRMHRSKELDSQLDHFLAQAEKDNAESSVHDTDLSDPIEMTTQIKAIMIGTSGYPYFLGTLQNLLLIAARGSDKSVWEKVEQSTHDAVMTEEEATGETRLNLAKLKEAIQAKQQQKEESADKELNKRELMRKQFEEEQLAFKEKMRQEMDAVQQKHRTEKEEMELSFKLEIAELKKELSSLQTKLMEANNRNGSFQTTSSSSITTRTISSATNNGDKDLKQEENLSASPPPPGGAPPPPPGMPPPPPSGSGGPPPPPFGAPTMMMEADDPNQPRPSVPVKQLYWVKIPPVKKEQTIWQHIDHHNVEVETSTLEELFKLKQRHHDRDDENAGSSDAATDTDSKPSEEEGAKTSFTAVQKVKKKRTLIDPKRANNIAVMLAHFRLPLDSIRKSILELNMDVLTEHNVHQLLNYAPTEEEEQILAEFKDSPQEVGRVEQFFLQMLTIPRFKQRMATFAFKLNFKNHLEELEYDIDVICNATTELRNSPKFSKTLEVILAIGNFMNAGPRKPSAAGFKLSFLTKLGDTKSTDNKATMIHYLASLFHRNYPELLTTHTELKSVEEATKISADTILAEIKTMTSELAKLEEELALEYPPEDRYKEVMSHFHAEAVHHIQRILHKKDQMESAYRATLQFFGEEATMQSEDFFAQIHDFLLALEKAAKDNAREKVLAEKKQVMEAKKKEREEQKAKQGQMKARIKAKASVRQRGGGEERPTSIRKGVLDNLYGSMRKGAICREERQEE